MNDDLSKRCVSSSVGAERVSLPPGAPVPRVSISIRQPRGARGPCNSTPKRKKSKRTFAFATVRGGETITDRNDARLNQPFFESAAQREERVRVEAEARKANPRNARAAKREAPVKLVQTPFLNAA